MKETLRLALILFLITAISAFILAESNKLTEPIVAEAEAVKDAKAKQAILPASKDFKTLDDKVLDEMKSKDGNIVEVAEGLDGEETVGYVFKTLSKGYGGDINFMIGISTEGKIEGIEILTHTETPGLGANIERDSFKASFKDKAIAEGLSAVKEPAGDSEVQAITSATITSNAVVDEVNKVIEAYKAVLE